MDDSQEAVASRHRWVRRLSVAAVLVLILSGFALLNSARAASSPAPAPTAVGPRHDMYIGSVSLTIQTTNPLEYTLVDEYYMIGGVYSFLINSGPNWEVEPDIAVQWTQTNANPSTWNFKLAHNAYFVDPRGCVKDAQGHIADCPSTGSFPPHQVTADDVKFTWDFVKTNALKTTYFEPCVAHVASVTRIGQFEVTIAFDSPYAPAIAAFQCVPILPQYIWQTQAVDWTNALPIGSGPFIVRPVGTTFQMAPPPPLILDRNPLWHGKEVQGRQVYPDTIQYVSYTSSGAMSQDLTLGKIDLAISPNSQDYTTFLVGKPGVIRQSVPDGFEAEQAVNVLTDQMRAYFTSISSRPLDHGHSNPVLRYDVVRTAIHMATNRAKMIANAENGLATPGDTLLPLFHPSHYSVPAFSTDDKDSNGNIYDFPPFSPTSLEQFPDDASAPKIARDMLHGAGWLYSCATGGPDDNTAVPLCRKDGTGKLVDNLVSRFSTFNTEPYWETAARGVIEDAAKAGIQFTLELLNPSQMYSLWYKLDYDVWLWDWVWSPITDPSLALVVQTCAGIKTLDNDNGYCAVDPTTGRWTFDDLYNQTLVETNPVARRSLTDQMQNIIYGYASYNLPFYLDQLYALDEVRWTNWGDFRLQRALPPDIGNSPIVGQIPYPLNQKPPQFSLPTFDGVVSKPVQFSVAAVDPEGAPLSYRWDFDASTEAGGSGVNADGIPWNDDQGGSTPTPAFTYGAAGTYTIALRVSDGEFFTVRRTTVTIHAPASGNPTISGFSLSPSDPTTFAGDLTFLAASASDPQGLALTDYTWNWGDGTPPTTTTGPTASHQYATAGTHTAQVTVRSPSGGTSTSSTLVPVVNNVAPVISPLSAQTVIVGANNTYVAFASDGNARDVLTYSWTFGDGSPAASGNPVYHIYAATGLYTIAVAVSDAHGHSVSSSASVSVASTRNTAPNIPSLTSFPASSWTTKAVLINGTASDHEGNALLWQWDFNNDGVIDKSYTTAATAPDETTTRSETYLYTTAGSAKAKLTVIDQPPSPETPKSTFSTVTTSIATNTAPTLTDVASSPAAAIVGESFSFSSSGTDVNGDKLSWTWDFGDGATLSGQTPGFCLTPCALSTKHGYAAEGSYLAVLAVGDGKGGEARKSTLVTVASPGLLRVTTNPAVNGKILVDGVPRDEWGLAWMKVAPGTHTVSFSDIYGYATPALQTVTVTSGATTVAQGNYVQKGSLRVMTNPALAATISVNGQPADDWGVWRAAVPGSYTIHFGAVANWAPPADQTVTVTAGLLTTVTGTYTSSPGAPGPDPATYGLLRVTTNPAVASQILVNGIPRDEWGLAWVKLSPGTYTVSFTSVYGLTAPAPTTVTVSAGATTTVVGQFVVHGSLRVTTSPALAGTIFVDGSPRDDWGMWQSMPPGTYTVSFGAVPGYVTPAAQTATVTATVTTTITGTYAAAAPPTPLGTGTGSASPTASSAASPSPSSEATPSVQSVVSSTTQAASEPYAADGRVAVTKLDET